MFYVEHGKITSVEKAHIYDDVCYRAPGRCTLCAVNGPVREMRVRGLCKESIYDSKYFYNIGETGDIMYLGEEESKISFNMTKDVWTWTDRNFPDSLGNFHSQGPLFEKTYLLVTSNSPRTSLFLGVHTVDLSKSEDPCFAKSGSPIRSLKFTTCSDHQFTCDDGQCIDIEER